MTGYEAAELSLIDHLFHWCFQHWLTILTGALLLYSGLPWLVPLLLANGYTDAGNLLFALYGPLCHQSPSSSYFWLGHQVAYCHRDTAIYTTLLAMSLLYALLRPVIGSRPLAWRWFLLFLVPLILDGGTHLLDTLIPTLNLRDPNDAVGSLNWLLRTVTGMLAGIGFVLAIYPRLDRDLRGIGIPDEFDQPPYR